jgi:hypothetical protein
MAATLNWGETFKVLLDVGFVANGFTLDRSELNGVEVLDGSTDFVDITEYVQAININRGRSSQLDSFSPGTLTVVADDRAAERRFDPINTASPWYQGDLGIAPRRPIEIYGGSAGTTPLYKGYVYDLNIEYDEPNLSTATIFAVDALAQLGQTNLNAFTPSSQLTSDRITAILDRPEVAWSTALRSISTGIATCGTVPYEDQTNVLQALQAVQFAENGRLFADRNGNVNFDQRIIDTFATAVADLGGTAITSIPITALSTIYGAETVLNRVAVQISGGTASSIANGTASQAEYGIKNFSLTDIPLVNDAAGSALAASLLDFYQNPEVRFDEVNILVNPLSDSQTETMAALEIGDVLTVTKTFATGSPSTVMKDVVIEGIQHVVTPSRHDIRLRLGHITVLLPFVLDTSGLDDATYALY